MVPLAVASPASGPHRSLRHTQSPTADRPALHGAAREERVKTIDEMLSLRLLTPEQHGEIGAWIAEARTAEAIMRMPAALWRKLELASVLMDVDADLTRPPCFEAPE